jgi:endonuclease/exonuclease/phosphatase family metal-dependent hydrolase
MQLNEVRKFIKKTLVIINVIIVVVFLIGCLSPWLPLQFFSFMGFISIAMPYIIVVLIATLLFWLFAKPKYSLVLLLVLLVGYQQIMAIFAFNSNNNFIKTKQNYSLRIVSFNIANLYGMSLNKGSKKHSKEEVINSILKTNADIVCLQEFPDCTPCKPLEILSKKYPYYYLPGNYQKKQLHLSGCIILSKYKLLNTSNFFYNSGENIATANIVFNNDTLSIFCTHLQSFKFSKNEFNEINDTLAVDKTGFKNIVSKLNATFKIHGLQATNAKNFIAKSPHKSIVCGDFNDVPNSFTYFAIKGNMQDAFLEKGQAIGKTYSSIAPTLRIDYTFLDKNFIVNQFEIVDEELSDHSMLITDFSINK